MSNNWIYHWVQIMVHHKIKLGMLWLIMIVASVFGVLNVELRPLLVFGVLPAMSLSPVWLMFMSALLVSVFFAWQSESIRSGGVNFVMMSLAYVMTIGLASWFELSWGTLEVLALLIASTLVTANFAHLLSTLHREMARGLFQFDAVAEALKLNHTPIFLSNLTTALGVVFLAWFEPEFVNLAWVIATGVGVSYVLSISLFPWILLNFFLEFRVGNTRDRQGFYQWVQMLEGHVSRISSTQARWVRLTLLGGMLILVSVLVGFQQVMLPAGNWQMFLGFLLLLVLLFWFWWQEFRWAMLIVMIITSVAIIANLMILGVLYFEMQSQALPAGILQIHEYFSRHDPFLGIASNSNLFWMLMLIAPMGVVVDDLIHFFSRMKRAKLSVFASPKDSVRFAMMSVGRPILVTSITLILVMLLIIFVSQSLVVLFALNVLISIGLITVMVLWLLPFVMLLQDNAS